MRGTLFFAGFGSSFIGILFIHPLPFVERDALIFLMFFYRVDVLTEIGKILVFSRRSLECELSSVM